MTCVSRPVSTGIAWSLLVSAALAWTPAASTMAIGQAVAPSRPVTDGMADVRGARLHYLDTGGTGPAVFLLHAGTGSSQFWEHQLPAFSQAGYRVIAYDRRGYGRTVVPAGAPAATAADDLDGLRQHLKIDRFHLVGTAAGGIVATDYALSFPDRLRSLVIANSLVGVQDASYLEMGRRLRPEPFGKMPPDFRELGPSYRAANPEGTKRWLALEQESRAPGAPPTLQPSKNKVTFAMLESLKVPTLLITGEADLYTPPPALRQFAERIRGSEVLILHEVGHSAFWEQPENFNRAVIEFIRRH
jgi:pimeloyl-ACP methyl ester carboxylesterase